MIELALNRNPSIVVHIDYGQYTLADRLLSSGWKVYAIAVNGRFPLSCMDYPGDLTKFDCHVWASSGNFRLYERKAGPLAVPLPRDIVIILFQQGISVRRMLRFRHGLDSLHLLPRCFQRGIRNANSRP